MQCLGLDIGSTSIKGAVLDLESGQVQSIVKEPFPDPLPGLPTGWFEIDPLEVAARSRRVISQLLAHAPEAKSLFLCGQMGGVVIVDHDDLRPLTNYISWRDQRTLEPHPNGGNHLDQMRRRIDFEPTDSLLYSGDFATVMNVLGNELKPGSLTALTSWIHENADPTATVLPSNHASSIGDFVASQLTCRPPQMEFTQAIGVARLTDGDIPIDSPFGIWGIDHLFWPPLVRAHNPVGTCTLDGRELTVYPTLGDQQCALCGAGLQIGDLSINVSTGSQVSCITREFTPGPYQSRYYFNGTFLNTITHVPAGRSLNALVDVLLELRGGGEAQGQQVASIAHPSTLTPQPSPWEFIARAAAAAPDGAGGLQCSLSFFDGPLGREGQISGITTENLSVGNLFRAAFESMAENYDRLARVLWPSGDWQRVVLSGGLTQSVPILRELIERRFPGQVVESHATEETLLGLLDVAREVHALDPNR